MKDKKYCKVRDYCHYTGEYRDAAHSICNLKYSVPKKIPIVFHNGSNYDYHFIIKELAEEFKKQFTCLSWNAEKYITFTVPIEKEATKIDKNREEITKNISHILQFIDIAIFIATSLSNLVNKRSERILKIKCKYGHDVKNYKIYGIKLSFLEYIYFKEDLIEYKCLCCNNNYQQKFDEKLKELIFNTYKFSTHGNNKFILLLQKGLYPYEYMDDCERFNETSLPEKEDFYSHLTPCLRNTHMCIFRDYFSFRRFLASSSFFWTLRLSSLNSTLSNFSRVNVLVCCCKPVQRNYLQFFKTFKTVRALRDNETKLTSRNAFILDIFTLLGEKESKYDERSFF